MALTKDKFIELMEDQPIIASLKDLDSLNELKKSDVHVAYILFGDICNIKDIVDQVKKAGKYAIVHMDFIQGFSGKDICVDYIAQFTNADGIISTKPLYIKRANELGLLTIERFFMIDLMTYQNIITQAKQTQPDIVECLPAGLVKVLKFVIDELEQPIIAAGFVSDKEDVINALKAGCIAVATTYTPIWFM